MKITDLADFEVKDRFIRSGNNCYYFFRIIPPNLSIMNPNEKIMRIQGFQNMLDSNDLPMQILAMDKTEDLGRNKAFWKGLPERFEFVSDAILQEINEIENVGSGIQRTYYFVIQTKEQEKVRLFENLADTSGFRMQAAEHSELITIMKNFMLRDYIEFDIYTFEQEVQQIYESQIQKSAK